jgi:hypothetical protein
MTETAQQILVLILFAVVMYLANLKAGVNWLRFLTVVGFCGASGLASYLIVDWMLL